MITLQTQQILVPKQVYIGDKAELRCTFSTAEKIQAEGFCSELDYSQYDIKNVQLLPSGNNYYTLTITFIPWRTGEISLPDYSLSIEGSEAGSSSEGFIIHFNPVSIVSITEKDSITTLRDSASPLLLPGTIYKLYGSLVALIIILIIGIRLIVKHKDVAFFVKNLILAVKNNSNRRKTIKQLNKLAKNTQLADNDAAAEIQKIMRTYLEKRFNFPFSKTVSSEMYKSFMQITQGLLAEEKESAFEDIVTAFVRTDYIRYSSASSFNDGEKEALIKKLIEDIVALENTKQEKADVPETGTGSKEVTENA